jgi:hypothetical protein
MCQVLRSPEKEHAVCQLSGSHFDVGCKHPNVKLRGKVEIQRPGQVSGAQGRNLQFGAEKGEGRQSAEVTSKHNPKEKS